MLNGKVKRTKREKIANVIKGLSEGGKGVRGGRKGSGGYKGVPQTEEGVPLSYKCRCQCGASPTDHQGVCVCVCVTSHRQAATPPAE